MAFEIKALLTDQASRRTAESWATGKSFQIVGFALGNAGHDPLDQIVYSPVPGDPELNDTFLFAVANFPQRPKTDLEKLTIRVGVQR